MWYMLNYQRLGRNWKKTVSSVVVYTISVVKRCFHFSLGVFGVLESVKAASDLYSPLSGTVVDVNSKLSDSPELINEKPYTEGV